MTVVSCLCVTEDREAFAPWLLWSLRRQTWTKLDVVVVSGSPFVTTGDEGLDVRVIRVPAGTNIPEKRNVALDAARGEIVVWFDDDDWQHPQRVERLVEALADGHAFAGWAAGWFVDLARRRCAQYRPRRQVLFNGAGFRTEVARSVRFDTSVRRASDSRWLRALASRHRGQWRLLPGDDAFFWLCHETNISNPAIRRRFPHDLDRLRTRIGEAWLDTDEQLDALRERLRGPVAPREAPTIVVGPARAPDPTAPDRETEAERRVSADAREHRVAQCSARAVGRNAAPVLPRGAIPSLGGGDRGGGGTRRGPGQPTR